MALSRIITLPPAPPPRGSPGKTRPLPGCRALPAARATLARSACWGNVLVEPEEIGGIIRRFDRRQPRILGGAIGRLGTPYIVLGLVINIQAPGRERLSHSRRHAFGPL